MASKRGKEGKTKQEILLYLSDGTRKWTSDIKMYVMTELQLKQSSGINRHLRDLEQAGLVHSDGDEKGVVYNKRGSRMEMSYFITHDVLQISKIFIFLQYSSTDKMLKKFMLSSVYRDTIQKVTNVFRRHISKIGLLDYGILPSVSFEGLLELMDRIQLNLVSKAFKAEGIETYLYNLLLTSADASRVVFEYLLSILDPSFVLLFEQKGKDESITGPSETQAEYLKNHHKAFGLIHRAITISSETGAEFYIVMMLLMIKEALAAVDYTNIVIPEYVYKSSILHSNLSK